MVRIFGRGKVGEADVRRALEQVSDPASGKNVMAMGIVQGIAVEGRKVAISIETTPQKAAAMEPLRQACEEAVRTLRGVKSASVVLTAETAPTPPPAAEPRPDAGSNPPPGPATGAMAEAGPGPIGEIRAIIAVASGKGGVGKSTVAVNLALGLKALGKTVGILDADIYGPSLPRMLAISGQPEAEGNTIMPMNNHGLACMSIGFLVPEDTATIWRGPMVSSALTQMLTGVAWGKLDVLVVDMPPGTGDIHLTLAQRAPITGALIVSTPQDIALVDARKGLAMFNKVKVPVFGFVENMSYFACPHCGERTDIFSHGGARKAARDLGTDFLGEIPLDATIRETSDAGQPIVAQAPDSPQAAAFMAIASRVAEKIDLALAAAQKTPKTGASL